MQTVFEPLFAWRWKGIVTRAEFHFCWIDTFSVQLSSPRNWCIRTGETDCRANTFFDCIACQPFHMAVSFIAMCFLLAFLGAPVGPQQWVKKQVNYPTKFAKTCLVVYHHSPPQNISWRRPWAPDVKHDNRSVFFSVSRRTLNFENIIPLSPISCYYINDPRMHFSTAEPRI